MDGIFPYLPRTSVEVNDGNLKVEPLRLGRKTVVLGCLDADGYGYLSSNDPTDADFVTPASVIRFEELVEVTDLAQFRRLYGTDRNVGLTDELSPAIAEIVEQGTTNIAVMRLDMALLRTGSTLYGVQQSTGLPPLVWLNAMGFTDTVGDGTGTWSHSGTLDPLTDYIPSVAYRTWVAGLLDVVVFDATTPQAHLDPTEADMRYWAIGHCLNNLLGEDLYSLVVGLPTDFVNASRCHMELGVYPIRSDTVVTTPADILEQGAPTINNPNLQNVVMDPDTLAFQSFDVVGYDSATIEVEDASLLADGDTLTLNVGTSVLTIVAAAAEDTDAGEFDHAGTDAATATSIAAAINGIAADNTFQATASGTTVTLTSEVPGEGGRIGLVALVLDDPTALTLASNKASGFFTIVTNGDLAVTDAQTVTSDAVGTTIQAAAANDAANGDWAIGADAETTAGNMAAAINGQDSNVVAAAVTDGTSWYVTIFSTLGGVDYNLTLAESVEGTSPALTSTDGEDGATTLPTLSGAHDYAVIRNFAHLLGNFAHWETYFESRCKAFVPVEPMDTDLDGRLSNARVREYMGQERTNVVQYISDASDVPFTDDGAGILGFVNCEGFDGIHRYRSSDDTPVSYTFWATDNARTLLEAGRQEDVYTLSSAMGDLAIEDSINGNLMDLGIRLRIPVGDVFVSNQVSMAYNPVRGAYVTSAAASMAGLEGIRPRSRSLTHLRLPNVRPLHRMSNTHMNLLSKSRFVPIQTITESPDQALIIADNTGAWRIDDQNRSDFIFGLSIDCLENVMEDIRKLANPLIGEGLTPLVQASFVEHVEARLKALMGIEINGYNFEFLATPTMQVLGEAQFKLQLQAPGELRNINGFGGLTMPTASISGAAAAA